MRIARGLHPSPVGSEPQRPNGGLSNEFDEGRFQRRISSSDFCSELFVSPAHAEWEKGRFSLRKKERGDAKTDISGVRFQACDLSGEDQSLEKETQHDLAHLVKGLRQLRELPGLSKAVLLGDDLRAVQPIRGKGSRVKFGLRVPGRAKTDRDEEAAAKSHSAILRAIRRSHLVLIEPKEFDAKSGLVGLQEWGSKVRLRRRKRPPLWLLPLLLLPLLLLHDCDGPGSFLGFSIGHKSLLVVIDKSSSMESLFPRVRDEARATLAAMKSDWRGDRYVDVIVFDGHATSALGGMQKVTAETEAKLNTFLDQLEAGGGTHLRSALELAAREVAAHDRPTTLVILTDGQSDPSVRETLADFPQYIESFAGVEVVGHTVTPRLLTDDTESKSPANPDEEALSELAEKLGGTFGSRKR